MALSPKQLQTLGAEARKAFASVCREDLDALRTFLWDQTPHNPDDPFAGPHMIAQTTLFNYWRRREVANALRERCKRKAAPPNSFKILSQTDYGFVLAHFVGMYNFERGVEIFNKAKAQEYATVMALLEKSCRERGLDYPSYPNHVCKDQFRCEVEDASVNQLWCLVYTVRNRRYCHPKNAQPYDTTRNFSSKHPQQNN